MIIIPCIVVAPIVVHRTEEETHTFQCIIWPHNGFYYVDFGRFLFGALFLCVCFSFHFIRNPQTFLYIYIYCMFIVMMNNNGTSGWCCCCCFFSCSHSHDLMWECNGGTWNWSDLVQFTVHFFSLIVVIRCHRRDYSLVIGLLLPYMPIINNITQSNIYSDQNFKRLICNNCFRYTVFSFGICNLCEQIIYGATTGTKTTKIICWNRFTCVDCICVPCGMLRLSCLRAMAAGTSNLAGHHTHCRWFVDGQSAGTEDYGI